ncbi:MAG: Type 1 glutamine amidotransferase-like domain-containing protein [bacterium]
MKTKFILQGGNSSKKSDDNEKFFHEIINSVSSETVKILCVYFARLEDRWEDSFDEDQAIFLNLATKKDLEIKMAVLEKEELVEQIKNADVVFVNGGRRGCLKETLQNLENFSELIDGKVVVGISAGANILSRYYYANTFNEIREGVGILPIKLICHYLDEYGEVFEQLDNYKEKLPIYKIEEEKYLIFS